MNRFIFSLTITVISLLTFKTAFTQAVPDCGAVSGAVITTGFTRPESIQWYPKGGYWLVSNQGSPTDPTDGFISQLNPDGSILELKWATGLGHPLGIRIFEDKLYVADRDFQIAGHGVILVYNLSDAKLNHVYELDPTLLNGGGPNDPVIDKKTDSIYVSVFSLNETLGNTVLQIPLQGDGSDAVQLVPPNSIGPQPNGTLLVQNSLIVLNSDGEFYQIDLNTGDTELLGATVFMPEIGVLDGVERIGGKLIYTMNGLVNTGVGSFLAEIRFQPKGDIKEALLCEMAPNEGAADIGIDRDAGIIAIPHLFGHKITFLSFDALGFE